MRVLGVDLNIALGNKNGSMAICTLDDYGGTHRVVDMHVGETGENVDKMVKTLTSVFEINNCDYIAISSVGALSQVAFKLKEKFGDKVKDDLMNLKSTHNMFVMLQDDKPLNRLGIEFKYKIKNGYISLDTDVYEDFESSMVYSIALANRVLNIENKKVPILQQIEEAKETLKGLTKQLDKLELNNK